jgi:hypothetical protein
MWTEVAFELRIAASIERRVVRDDRLTGSIHRRDAAHLTRQAKGDDVGCALPKLGGEGLNRRIRRGNDVFDALLNSARTELPERIR